MYALRPQSPEAVARWEKALRLVSEGVPHPEVIRRTGIHYATFYRRIQRRRELMECRPQPMSM